MSETLLMILAGLILFLYAVSSLSTHLNEALGDRARDTIARYTSHTLGSILVGIITTAILDSSSAVIIMAIVMVNARVMTFRQAMGIVLGANIGTTVSSQIIALDVARYSPLFLAAGFVLMVASRSDHVSRAGRVLLYFGVLFFGLFTMEHAVEPLRDEPFFTDWMQTTEHPLRGALVGALVTLVIQSSSATVGMAIVLAKKGLLSLSGGIAVMLGAELGTVSDTLVATIRGSRDAVKTGLFHLTFNLISIVLGLLLFGAFQGLVQQVSGDAPIERAIANAHMMFNGLGVVLFAWTLPWFERTLNRLLPNPPA